MFVMASRWVLLAVVAVHLGHCIEENGLTDTISHVYEPTWMYKCVPDEGCQRTRHHQLSDNNTSLLFGSLDVCRTVCGRFGGLWPRPVTAAISMQTVGIHPNYLRFDLANVPVETRELLVEMTKVVGENLFAECDGDVTEMVETPVIVFMNVKTDDMTLSWETNEAYALDVQTKETQIAVHIHAETVYGARHALETFTQLVAADKPDYSDQKKCGLQLVTGAKIRDRPVYKHRGLLLDCSRHFIPMVDIKRTIDGMAANKMNIFHWHVTDSHSFPLESTRVPQFTRYGAYSANEIYSAEEVRELIKYAQVRGVRVVIEIDAPAHAGNGWQWGKEYGFGELAVCVNQWPWRHLCVEPPCGQLNPANPAMYRVLRDLYRDIAEAIPQPALLHMGGDEVCIECWNATEEITNYMKQKKFETNENGFIELWAEFHQKALEAWDQELEAANGTPPQPVMLWSSELTQAHRIQQHLSKERYVIQVWEPINSPLLNQLIKQGYRTVSVPKDIWYLDHGFWGTTKYSNWRRMYAHTLPRDDNFLGGEVAMWTEYLDEQGLDTRVWPRAAAVGERLWADPVSGVQGAEPRLQRQRARLLSRGLRPDALGPAWCAQHDAKCF
ncbi:chitooligosaccharidolytic beta-N-acetylglucosaminidase isoform X2 [Trichoplusia ni]|uniref:Chitooligosaccharidolytic beta-N-acetylglucosaminidase n=1 Tax=Trichoplusia ni TaxID=7111 RepID=A0A7E5WB47_TRINI|nr:chitooligosaccharidolytic beta-N-acetylglucosaminidase isoform X2 [Trichoplusia ni]